MMIFGNFLKTKSDPNIQKIALKSSRRSYPQTTSPPIRSMSLRDMQSSQSEKRNY